MRAETDTEEKGKSDWQTKTINQVQTLHPSSHPPGPLAPQPTSQSIRHHNTLTHLTLGLNPVYILLFKLT